MVSLMVITLVTLAFDSLPRPRDHRPANSAFVMELLEVVVWPLGAEVSNTFAEDGTLQTWVGEVRP